MPACAFLTMHDLTGFVSYDALVHEPLAQLGWSVEQVPWRSDADWGRFDMVVIRTTWDYQQSPAAFMRVLERIAAATRLENTLATVRWNLSKRYLRELARNGVAVVPTLWLDGPDTDALRAAFERLGTDRAVVKPEVGANADDAVVLDAPLSGDVAALRSAADLFARRRCLVQPFVRSVIDEGEYSLVFFDGDYSHAILKTPQPGDFRVQEEHGGVIRAVAPEPRLIERARHAVHAAAAVRQPLYARADFVRLEDDEFALMELELIEPSLYLSYDDDAPSRFARAIDARASVRPLRVLP